MSRITKAISDDLLKRVEEALTEVGRGGDVSRKLQAIKSARIHGIKRVAAIFDISRVALMSWISLFDEAGIGGLKLRSGRGRKSIISDGDMAQIKEWILADSNVTIKALKIKIEELLSYKLSMSRVYQLIKKLRFSYITPRPIHYKQDKNQQAEFKKKAAGNN